jgi:hypothetical protein
MQSSSSHHQYSSHHHINTVLIVTSMQTVLIITSSSIAQAALVGRKSKLKKLQKVELNRRSGCSSSNNIVRMDDSCLIKTCSHVRIPFLSPQEAPLPSVAWRRNAELTQLNSRVPKPPGTL